jgi:hypothetical protein
LPNGIAVIVVFLVLFMVTFAVVAMVSRQLQLPSPAPAPAEVLEEKASGWDRGSGPPRCMEALLHTSPRKRVAV